MLTEVSVVNAGSIMSMHQAEQRTSGRFDTVTIVVSMLAGALAAALEPVDPLLIDSASGPLIFQRLAQHVFKPLVHIEGFQLT